MATVLHHLFLCILILHTVLSSAVTDQRVHFALNKRGGRLTSHEAANLTCLEELLQTTERRYTRTRRVVQGNRLARKWRSKTSGTVVDEDLLREPGRDGRWFFNLEVGTPAQLIEVDLDMLSPDFYLLTTTSERGTKYNTFASTSHVSNTARVHPLCQYPADTFHLQHLSVAATSHSIPFALCSPSKSSQSTLLSSGGILGLSPSSSTLSRLSSPPFLQQLVSSGVLASHSWSLTLLDGASGVLTLGGTIAREVEAAGVRVEVELERLGQQEDVLTQAIDDEVSRRLASFPSDTEDQFKWISLSKSGGGGGLYHPLLMTSLFVSTNHPSSSSSTATSSTAAKILRNQPFLLDIQCPFILAPPLAAARFYSAIPGSQQLSAPHDRFWIVPCLKRVDVAFEVAGWLFAALRGDDGAGMMGLGKWDGGEDGTEIGTGFCVGVVVEARVGSRGKDGLGEEKGKERRGGSGLEDSWVLGEPFFRGMGVVFDGEKERVGFRTY